MNRFALVLLLSLNVLAPHCMRAQEINPEWVETTSGGSTISGIVIRYFHTTVKYSWRGTQYTAILKNVTGDVLQVQGKLCAHTACGKVDAGNFDEKLAPGKRIGGSDYLFDIYSLTGIIEKKACTLQGIVIENFKVTNISEQKRKEEQEEQRKEAERKRKEEERKRQEERQAQQRQANENNARMARTANDNISSYQSGTTSKQQQSNDAYQQYLQTQSAYQNSYAQMKANDNAMLENMRQAGQQILDNFQRAQDQREQNRLASIEAAREERRAEREAEEEAEAERARKAAAEAAERARQERIIREEAANEMERIKSEEEKKRIEREQQEAVEEKRKRIAEEKKQQQKRMEEMEEQERKDLVKSRIAYMTSIEQGKYPNTFDKDLGDTVYAYFVSWDSITYDHFYVRMSDPVMIRRMSDKTWPLASHTFARFEKLHPATNIKMISYYPTTELCKKKQEEMTNALNKLTAKLETIEINDQYYK